MASKIPWFLENIYTREQVQINKSSFRVGRAAGVDLICKSINVSRKHAQILVYMDGTLHVKEYKTMNGTYVNKILIQKDDIYRLKEGDEIGFGSHSEMELGTRNSLYVYKVRKNTLVVKHPNLLSDISEDRLQRNANCDPIGPLAQSCPVTTTLSSSKPETDSSKSNEINIAITSDKAKTLNVEPKILNGYVVDDTGCIVIDDIDEPIIKKEPQFPSFTNDTMFCNVKKELEELDKYDDANVMPTYYVDSDCESSQDWNDVFDILDDSHIENKEEENTNEKITSKNVEITNSPKISLPEVQNKTKEKHVNKPPIISPHFEKTREINNKRKSSSTATNNELVKKVKTDTFYGSKSKQGCKQDIPVENIVEARKRKLQEIADKSNIEPKETKSIKGHTAKVKVSNGRGKFLEIPCDLPSTSKVSKPEKRMLPLKKPVLGNKKPEASTLTKPCKVILTKESNTINSIVPTTSHNRPLLPVSHVSNSFKQLNGYKDNEHDVLIQDVEDVILEMLAWHVSWFSDRNYCDKVPVLSRNSLQRMNVSFSNYAEYYNIVMPLLMVEVWNFLYKEVDFNFVNEQIIYFSIEREDVKHHCTELHCLTYLPKNKNFKEGDVIVLQLYLENNHCATRQPKIAVLGYVTYVNRKNLANRETPSTSKNQSTKTVAVHTRIMIRRLDRMRLERSGNSRPFLQHITSFISSARTIRSIKYLENSPLCQHVLRPSFKLYKVPSGPVPQLYLKNELNPPQLQAVTEATNLSLNDKPGIYLIHGPPGTGKTTVIINIVLSIILDARFKDRCILLTAPTNAAVDELAVRIIAAKTHLQDHHRKLVDMVRIGPMNSIRAEVQDYSLFESAKRSVWRHLLKHESIENRRRLKEMKEKADFWKYQKNNPEAKIKYKTAALAFEECCKDILGRKYYERINEFENVLLKGARIICTTLSSCASIKMERVFSSHPGRICCCIVDEATQSTEQETLIPLILGVDKLILVGDPKQLPAVSFAQESKAYGFGQSLFSRIDTNFKNASYNPIKFLNTQYRMHPSMCMFPNKEFYEGRLKTDPGLFSRKSPLNALKPYLVFHFQGDTNAEEYRNKSEIMCVILLLECIVAKIPDSCNFTVGIVTPYNDQKDGIIENIKRKTFRNNVIITVNTVDSFQGRENDVMIMSCVRYQANSFLSDEQRLNVALTRARFALYIIGSTNLFLSCSIFGKIRKDAESRSLLKNLDTRMPKASLSRIIVTEC